MGLGIGLGRFGGLRGGFLLLFLGLGLLRILRMFRRPVWSAMALQHGIDDAVMDARPGFG